jgi:hypothetical protein
MLPAMKAKTRRIVVRFAEKLNFPLAVLSVAVVWHCWSIDGVEWDLAHL